jgi:hypothetical protein
MSSSMTCGPPGYSRASASRTLCVFFCVREREIQRGRQRERDSKPVLTTCWHPWHVHLRDPWLMPKGCRVWVVRPLSHLARWPGCWTRRGWLERFVKKRRVVESSVQASIKRALNPLASAFRGYKIEGFNFSSQGCSFVVLMVSWRCCGVTCRLIGFSKKALSGNPESGCLCGGVTGAINIFLGISALLAGCVYSLKASRHFTLWGCEDRFRCGILGLLGLGLGCRASSGYLGLSRLGTYLLCSWGYLWELQYLVIGFLTDKSPTRLVWCAAAASML